MGVDVDLTRIRESYDNGKRAGVAHRVTWLRQSFFDVDLRDATVVTMYLLPSIHVKLRPKLLWELRPGARIVCNYFDMGDWIADAKVNVCQRVLHLFHIPAWIGGVWDCVMNTPHRRERMRLTIKRRYQHVWGFARLGRSEVPLSNATLCGDALTFELNGMRYRCRVEDHFLRGTCIPARGGAMPLTWGALRHIEPAASAAVSRGATDHGGQGRRLNADHGSGNCAISSAVSGPCGCRRPSV